MSDHVCYQIESLLELGFDHYTLYASDELAMQAIVNNEEVQRHCEKYDETVESLINEGLITLVEYDFVQDEYFR